MKRLFVGMTILAMTGAAMASGPGAARKRVEASMLVTGSITVAPDGSVKQYALDKPDKLPVEIVVLVQHAAASWHFDPVKVDGQPVTANAKMNLRIVARHADDNADSAAFVAHIAGATFGDYGKGGEDITYEQRKPPAYPTAAVQGRVEGTVYLLLRVDHDGKVVDATAEQVNLGIIGSDPELRAWRRTLATPSVQAAKNWTFRPPTKGAHVNDPFYVIRVPVEFHLSNDPSTVNPYGQWTVYVPGPKDTASWANDGGTDASSPDALPGGQLYLVGTGLKLLTPLDKS